MNSFEAFQLYHSLKLHFTTDYDYFKYGGRTKISVKSFEKRNDRLLFKKLAKHKNLLAFCVSNFINKSVYPADFEESVYEKYMKRHESLLYIFKNDLKKLKDNFNSNFDIENKFYVLHKYMYDDLSPETVVILCDLTRCIPYWKKHLFDIDSAYSPFYSDAIFIIEKYTPFVKYERKKYRDIIINHYKDNINNT